MARTAAERQRSAAVRAWGIEQGLLPEDSKQGRIAAAVYNAYDGAHPMQVVAEDAPDWGAAAAVADAGDPLAGVEHEPPLPSHPPAPEPGPEPPGPPPPADLDEARARMQGAPSTGRRLPPWGKQAAKPKPEPQPIKVTPAVQADVRGQLVLLLGALAVPWELADPYCGGEFADTVEAQVDAWLPLICQSPTAVAWFTKGTVVMMWIGLISTYRGLAVRAWHHHVVQDVVVIDGQAYEATRTADGKIVPKRAPEPAAAQQQAAAANAMYPTVTGHVPPVHQAG